MKLNDDNYVDLAENAMKQLSNLRDKKGKIIPMVTTSKIRNILAMTADIYNEAINTNAEALSSETVGRINYLKIRIIYEVGREHSVRNFVEKAEILEHLDEIKGSRKQYILFSHYMEALVAFHKYYNGKD